MVIPPLSEIGTVNPPKRTPWEYENPLCAEVGIEVYYLGEEEDGTESRHYNEEHVQAISLCKSCSHVVECLSWGTYHERYGIWGGTTPGQRRLIRRANSIILDTQTSAA